MCDIHRVKWINEKFASAYIYIFYIVCVCIYVYNSENCYFKAFAADGEQAPAR